MLYINRDANHKKLNLEVLIAVMKKNREAFNILIRAGASFSTEAVFQERGSYISDGKYKWTEDRFPLSEYAFSDETVNKMGDLLRTNGWRGKKFGFLGKTHRCYFGW